MQKFQPLPTLILLVHNGTVALLVRADH